MTNAKLNFQNAMTTILVVCAVAVASSAVYATFHRDNSPGDQKIRADDWRIFLKGRKVNLGSSNAKLKIIEFSDYECPYCRTLETELDRVVDKYHGNVAVIRYDLPLEKIHPYAFKAAIASRCAEIQNVFSPVGSRLFKDDLATIKWDELAKSAGVPDVPSFLNCIDKDLTKSDVEKDVGLAMNHGIKSTPVLIINGLVFPGAPSDPKSLDNAIDSALQKL